MIILEDSRQQKGRHDNINAWMILHDIEIRRTKLYVGDYTLPADQRVCIDTKYGLQEVYGNLIQDHRRFTDECKAAFSAGIRLIVLVEQSGIKTVQDVAKWKNPRTIIWERLRDAHKRGKHLDKPLSPYPPVSSERLAKAMQTIAERYHIEWRFCDKADTARTICEILGIEVGNNE
jgi:hypothetical protein